jgi:hypothetical protein
MALVRNTFAFLRNKNIFDTRSEAISSLRKQLREGLADGSMILARYKGKSGVKTLAGIVFSDGKRKSLSVLKVDGIITETETNGNNLHYADLYKETQPG